MKPESRVLFTVRHSGKQFYYAHHTLRNYKRQAPVKMTL